MTVEFAHVSKTDGDHVWVEKSVESSCSGCAAQSDCGTSAIQKYLSKSYRTVKVSNQCGAVEGDRVAIEIEDALLLKLSLVTYFMPLCAFILGCVIGAAVFHEYKNLASIASGVMALTCAVTLVRAYTTWLFKGRQSPLKATRVLA